MTHDEFYAHEAKIDDQFLEQDKRDPIDEESAKLEGSRIALLMLRYMNEFVPTDPSDGISGLRASSELADEILIS